MARISIAEAEQFKGSSGGADYFSLKDDGDKAKVRFLYEDINDVGLDVVHEIEVDGKKRYVSCLRHSGDAKDVCPLCAAGEHQQVKMFIPLYNEDEGKVQVWQRGRTFVSKISGLMGRCNPLCGTVIEVTRQGRKGDQKTDYQLWPDKTDGTRLADLPEAPDLSKGMVLEKSYQDLENYIKTGSFENAEVQRRPRF